MPVKCSFRTVLIVALLALGGCGDMGDDKPTQEGAKAGERNASDAKGKRGERRGRGEQEVSEERLNKFRNRPVPVAVASVQRGRVDAFYASTTSLTAEEEASVVARTQGIVERIEVEEGDVVAKGDVLAQLDTRRLALEIARTETNIKSLERAFERAQQLNANKMISPDLFDTARFNLEGEQASLALQQHERSEATIRAPIDGVVTVRHIKLGNTLSPNDPAFEIKRALTIEAILNVPEKELAKIQVEQYATVRVDALGSASFAGTVARIAPEVDPTSGTFRVTVQIDNFDHLLKPGMFARVDIRYDSNEDTLLVAREAVVVKKGESSVFVVRDGLASRQSVTTGYSMGNDIQILEGLAENDRVVITGQGGLRDGSPVRVVSI